MNMNPTPKQEIEINAARKELSRRCKYWIETAQYREGWLACLDFMIRRIAKNAPAECDNCKKLKECMENPEFVLKEKDGLRCGVWEKVKP